MRVRGAVIATLAAAVSVSPAPAQSRGGLILALPTSPRTLGTADVSLAQSPDAWAAFSAPALLARIPGVPPSPPQRPFGSAPALSSRATIWLCPPAAAA